MPLPNPPPPDDIGGIIDKPASLDGLEVMTVPLLLALAFLIAAVML